MAADRAKPGPAGDGIRRCGFLAARWLDELRHHGEAHHRGGASARRLQRGGGGAPAWGHAPDPALPHGAARAATEAGPAGSTRLRLRAPGARCRYHATAPSRPGADAAGGTITQGL